MTVTDDTAVVRGLIDREGRLVEADARLAALQAAAGGALAGPVAVPAVASIARLANALKVVVSRQIVIGGTAANQKVWIRAEPEDAGVRLSLVDWTVEAAPQRAFDEMAFAELEASESWACDAALMLTRWDGGETGGLLTRWLRFLPDDKGETPIIEALALRQAFSGQLAETRDAANARLLIHGAPQYGEGGEFAGFGGGFRRLDRAGQADGEVPATPLNVEGFAERLHEALRAPIGRIVRNADAIAQQADGEVSEQYVGYASDIALASRHLLSLADDLHDLQTIESDGFAAEATAIDVADVARRAAGLLGIRAAERGVRINLPPADEKLWAIGDFRRVLQIVANLIGNAVRHTPQDSMVWICLEQEDDTAALIVADQGAGISREDHDRIFDKFTRLSPGSTPGSGLGLYISRRLARAMGGDLTVDSAPGQGARFILTLPRENID